MSVAADQKVTKHDVAFKQAELAMVRVRYRYMTIVAALVCVTLVLIVPRIASAMAGKRTVVQFNSLFAVTWAASLTINVVLALAFVSTLQLLKRGRARREG